MTKSTPQPAHRQSVEGPLVVDRDLYGRLADRTDSRTLLERFVIPIRSGRAWTVRAGQLCRIVAIEGPQVGDLTPLEPAQPARAVLGVAHASAPPCPRLDPRPLWSTLPYLRPLATITADTVQYGVDDHGARCHDLLGTRCDPYVNELLTGEPFDFHCHSNLTRAVLPHGLTELDVHDVLNVFQVTGLTADGDQYYIKASPARRGDFLEFLA